MSDTRNQPPLPFEPPVQLVSLSAEQDDAREVSFDDLTALLFEEFSRRVARVGDSPSR